MTLLTNIPFRATDSSGEILPGARLQFYIAGTTTPVEVFTDAEMTVQNTNPVVADAGGLFVPIYLPGGNYRVELQAASGAIMQVIDPLPLTPDPQAANMVLESLEGLLPLASQFGALGEAVAAFTDTALLQQFVTDFGIANNALGAGGLQGLGADVALLQKCVARLDTYHPPIAPTVARFPVCFDVEDDFIGQIFDFEPEISDADSPIGNLTATIIPSVLQGSELVDGLSLDGFRLVADGTQAQGVFRHRLRVTDEKGLTADRQFEIVVRAAGSAPVVLPRFADIPNITNAAGSDITFRDHTADLINAADLAVPITVTTSVEPTGSGITFSNGVRSGTAGTVGTYTVQVTATDSNQRIGQAEYTVTIEEAEPPVWTALPGATDERGAPNFLIDLTPYVTPGVTIDEPIAGAPDGTQVNGLIVEVPTGEENDETILYNFQYTARNASGQTSQSPLQSVVLINPNSNGLSLGFGGGGGFGGFGGADFF